MSYWRYFTPCKGPRRFTNGAFGTWIYDPHFAHKREWTTLEEEEGLGSCDVHDTFQRRAAERIVSNGGGRVTGRGGVGKTQLIKEVVELFKAVGYEVSVLASTHVQAAFCGGTTIFHISTKARGARGVS